jgi:flavin-dependent thymidylate synthase
MNTSTKDSYRNTVQLLGHYGGDREHACSAWTSTSRDLTPDKLVRIPTLLKMLADNHHNTPFEKSSLHFLCRTDIASHIHIIKHRIGVSVNGESARYKELKDGCFYVPQDWDDEEVKLHIEFCEHALKEYHETLERLVSKGVPRKRAKESARLKLPYATQIQCDVMFNFRSFAHFLGLRYSEHAQMEIRDIAKTMLEQVVAIEGNPFQYSLRAFGYINETGTLLREPHK